jgi:hypothetical protein
VHTPVIEKIELVKKGDVRRAKLYYLRDLRGKAAKIREKRDGIEGYGDGILSTPVAAVVETPVAEAVVEAPVQVTEQIAEVTSEAGTSDEASASVASDTEATPEAAVDATPAE